MCFKLLMEVPLSTFNNRLSKFQVDRADASDVTLQAVKSIFNVICSLIYIRWRSRAKQQSYIRLVKNVCPVLVEACT